MAKRFYPVAARFRLAQNLSAILLHQIPHEFITYICSFEINLRSSSTVVVALFRSEAPVFGGAQSIEPTVQPYPLGDWATRGMVYARTDLFVNRHQRYFSSQNDADSQNESPQHPEQPREPFELRNHPYRGIILLCQLKDCDPELELTAGYVVIRDGRRGRGITDGNQILDTYKVLHGRDSKLSHVR